MIARSLETNDIFLLVGLALFNVLAGIGAFLLSGGIVFLSAGPLLIALCGVALLLEARRTRLRIDLEQRQRQMNMFRQMDSLISLNAFLSPLVPLPQSGGWAASADFLKLIVDICACNRPVNILEASSGLSTLVCAYALKRLKIDGKVFSLEHDIQYVEQTKRLVENHGLQHFVSIIYAPLTQCACCGDALYWYDTSALPADIAIDLFVVDGPPCELQQDARRPAVPLLYDRLSDGAVILLDDANRPAEQDITKQWMRKYPKLTYEYFAFEKGAVTLTKCGRSI